MTDPTERTKDMTVTDTVPRNGTPLKDLPPAVQRERAREMARSGTPTGEELGQLFGKSGRWGRLQIAAVADPEGSGTPERNGTGAERAALVPVPTARPAAAAKPVNGTTHTPAVAPVRPSKQPTPKAEPVPPVPPQGAPSGLTHAVTVLGVIVVAGVAAVLSYAHMRHLAIEAGEGWRADLLPLSVDGVMVVASMTALAQRRAGQRAYFAWMAIFIGIAASLAANVAAAEPTLKGRLVAGWAPVALLFAFELLLQQGRTNNRKEQP